MPHLRSLHEGEELVRRILDAVPGGVVHVGLDGAIKSANAEAQRLLGLRFDELAKRFIADWDPVTMNEDGAPCPVADYPVARALATGEPDGPRTIGVRRPDGVVTWAVFRAVPVHDAQGALDGAIVTFLDITERKRAEDELRRSEEKWRAIAQNIPDFVVILDDSGIVLQISRVFSHTTEQSVVGSCIFDYVEPPFLAEYRRTFERALETGTTQRIVARAFGLDRIYTWYEAVFVPLREAEPERRILVVARDMTEQKRAEDATRASEQKWRALVDSLPDSVVVVDRERRILSSNRRTDAVGASCDLFVDETMLDDWRQHFARALETKAPVRYEGRARTAAGALAWYESILVPLEENGEVARVMIVARDITERRAMLASLAERERLASVGMVAASVAHEIMNPLTYVLANLDFALGSRPTDEERWSKALAEAREGAKRMQQIVWDLRSLARVGGEELFYVDARSVLETALRLSGPEVGRAARVVLDLGEVPGVLASESQLCQVFINLLVNAAQAMEDRAAPDREIRVRTRYDEERGLVGVEISDRGVGIAADRLDRIFEPFYTTKRTGTGLGLSISRDIVERMGGRIDVESAPERGTTFTVWLSTTRAPVAGAAQ